MLLTIRSVRPNEIGPASLLSWPRVSARTELILGAVIVLQCLIWTLAPLASYFAPPEDVVEMYAWGREGVIATYKHPDLPGLILEAIRRLTGQVVWPAYLVSQVCILATLWAVYRLGCDLMDPVRALAGTLLLTGVYYFSVPTPEFNHNVLQMPFWAMIALCLHRATSGRGGRYWILLGLAAGLGMWAKYSTALILAPALAWSLADRSARRCWRTPWPYLGAAAFLAVTAPQAWWLYASGFAPMRFAESRTLKGGPLQLCLFLLGQAATHLPMALLLLVGGAARQAKPTGHCDVAERDRRFLILMGFGPLGLSCAAALITGGGLRSAWSTTMFDFSGLIAVMLLGERIWAIDLKRFVAGVVALMLVFAGGYYVQRRYASDLTGQWARENWPQAAISAQFEDQWRQQVGRPLRIVAGDPWLAGMIGLTDRSPPSILLDGRLDHAPWITPRDIEANGLLAVWGPEGAYPVALDPLLKGRAVQTLTFANPAFPRLKPVTLDYVIVRPMVAGGR